jgi:hypothetical protein
MFGKFIKFNLSILALAALTLFSGAAQGEVAPATNPAPSAPAPERQGQFGISVPGSATFASPTEKSNVLTGQITELSAHSIGGYNCSGSIVSPSGDGGYPVVFTIQTGGVGTKVLLYSPSQEAVGGMISLLSTAMANGLTVTVSGAYGNGCNFLMAFDATVKK